MKQIEKRWKALDQPMFVLALILNFLKGTSWFGEKAGISPFTLNTVLLEVSFMSSQHTKIKFNVSNF